MRSDNGDGGSVVFSGILGLPHRTSAKFNLICLSADMWIEALLIRASIVSLAFFLHTVFPCLLSLPPPPARCLTHVSLSNSSQFVLRFLFQQLISDSKSSKDAVCSV